jgi:hypothetical protein
MGQIIGDAFELAFEVPLRAFADEHDLYLDWKHPRLARGGRKLVEWEDFQGNTHRLDHVLERGGTEDRIGIPVAFIETAWRRYSKHARNKAQEIQSAVLPIVTKWSDVHPFAGAILAGEFTESSLDQLRSHGFQVLHVSYGTIIDVFAAHGIEVAYSETTSDALVLREIEKYRALTEEQRAAVGETLRQAVVDQVAAFVAGLAQCVLRKIEAIAILPLHGQSVLCDSIEKAIEALTDYRSEGGLPPLVRFEVIVRYDNGDRITADFRAAPDAITFLESFRN